MPSNSLHFEFDVLNFLVQSCILVPVGFVDIPLNIWRSIPKHLTDGDEPAPSTVSTEELKGILSTSTGVFPSGSSKSPPNRKVR